MFKKITVVATISVAILVLAFTLAPAIQYVGTYYWYGLWHAIGL